MLNVTMPSTSAGPSPASSSAARAASAASRSSLRPESLENSVAPMPAMAAVFMNGVSGQSPGDPHRGRDVVAQAAATRDGDHLLVAGIRYDLTAERERLPRVAGHAEPDGHPAHRRVRRPGRDVPLDQAGRGQDVDEDVLGA